MIKFYVYKMELFYVLVVFIGSFMPKLTHLIFNKCPSHWWGCHWECVYKNITGVSTW